MRVWSTLLVVHLLPPYPVYYRRICFHANCFADFDVTPSYLGHELIIAKRLSQEFLYYLRQRMWAAIELSMEKASLICLSSVLNCFSTSPWDLESAMLESPILSCLLLLYLFFWFLNEFLFKLSPYAPYSVLTRSIWCEYTDSYLFRLIKNEA